jgi:hypothetical protein
MRRSLFITANCIDSTLVTSTYLLLMDLPTTTTTNQLFQKLGFWNFWLDALDAGVEITWWRRSDSRPSKIPADKNISDSQ